MRRVRKLNFSRVSDPSAFYRPTPSLPNRVMLNCPPAPEEGDSHGHILMKTISERSCELVSIPRPFLDPCPLYPLPFASGLIIWRVICRSTLYGRCDLIRWLSFEVGVGHIGTRRK